MNWLLVNAILCVLFLGPWPVYPALCYGDDNNGSPPDPRPLALLLQGQVEEK